MLMVAQVEHQRRDPKPDGNNGRWIGTMLVVDLNGTVDGRVIDDATRERFILSQIEIHSESAGDLRQIAVAASTCAKPRGPSMLRSPE